VDATALLPGEREIVTALGPRVQLEPPTTTGSSTVGEVLRAAAVGSAYRHFVGRLNLDDKQHPIVVGSLGLVFDTAEKAARTFEQVGQAAHLRIQLGACDVAVETVTAPNGVVSYWAFVRLGEGIVVLTLDTTDPQEISMSDFRLLVSSVAERLEAAAER
jgi:hypothetical protein